MELIDEQGWPTPMGMLITFAVCIGVYVILYLLLLIGG
jgi:hypothetical protein